MDNKTIGVSALIAAGLIVASMVIPGFFDEPKYTCESRPEIGIKECDSFSKYVHELGKCIDDDGPNYICRTGWMLVTNDMDIDVPVYGRSSAPDEICSKHGCIAQ